MEKNLNAIAEYRLITEFINNIGENVKAWLVREIVNILIANKQL